MHRMFHEARAFRRLKDEGTINAVFVVLGFIVGFVA